MELNFNELRELVTTLSQSDISELTLKSAEFELTLRKQGALVVPTATEGVTIGREPAVGPVTELQPMPSPPPSTAPTPPPSVDSNLVEVTSPMVGTFYRSPAPEEPPFVDVGDRIQTGQTVCIIEAMKLMNELEAEVTVDAGEAQLKAVQTVSI